MGEFFSVGELNVPDRLSIGKSQNWIYQIAREQFHLISLHSTNYSKKIVNVPTNVPAQRSGRNDLGFIHVAIGTLDIRYAHLRFVTMLSLYFMSTSNIRPEFMTPQSKPWILRYPIKCLF